MAADVRCRQRRLIPTRSICASAARKSKETTAPGAERVVKRSRRKEPRLRQPTRLLDFKHLTTEALVQKRSWPRLKLYERIGAVYDFVRNEIAFGYDEGGDPPASRPPSTRWETVMGSVASAIHR